MSESAVCAAPAYRPHWSLPAAYYLADDIFATELQTVFRPGWLFAGHSCELRATGDYLVFALGADSVIVVRDEAGALRAHHNVCRHRGSRICSAPRGRARAFVCPYHQWVYGLDGQLRAARLMGTDFDTGGYRLATAAVREVAGLVFVCLDAEPPDFDPAAAAIERPARSARPDGRPRRAPRALPRRCQLEDAGREQPRVLPLPRQPSRVPAGQLRVRHARRPAPLGAVRPRARAGPPALERRRAVAGRGRLPRRLLLPRRPPAAASRLPHRDARRHAGRTADGSRRRRTGQLAADHAADPLGARQPRLRRHHAAHADQRVVHRCRRHLPGRPPTPATRTWTYPACSRSGPRPASRTGSCARRTTPGCARRRTGPGRCRQWSRRRSITSCSGTSPASGCRTARSRRVSDPSRGARRSGGAGPTARRR